MNKLALVQDIAMPLVAQMELSLQVLVWTLVLIAAGLLLTPKLHAWMAAVIAVVLGAAVVGFGIQWSTPLVTGMR